MGPKEIRLRIMGGMLFLAYEDERDIRLARIEGCNFEFDEVSPGVEAALWLADELRKRGTEIRGRRAWAGGRRMGYKTPAMPAQVGILAVDLARDLQAGEVLFSAHLHGFASPSCNKLKGGDLFHLISEFVKRADAMIHYDGRADTIFHDAQRP